MNKVVRYELTESEYTILNNKLDLLKEAALMEQRRLVEISEKTDSEARALSNIMYMNSLASDIKRML